MNQSIPVLHVQMLFSMFAVQLPILLVCLAGVVVILVRWKQASGGAIWALLGFGLALILCVVVPIVQATVQHWVMQHSDTISHRAPVLTGLSILWALLRAATYALLLVAVLAGRPASHPEARPRWSQNEGRPVV